jgi:hypothetical protein
LKHIATSHYYQLHLIFITSNIIFNRSLFISTLTIFALASAKSPTTHGHGGTSGNGGNTNSVCLPYKASHGSVFGLCNAYCKAKKCQDETTPTKSCLKLKEKFMHKTGETSLPCDAPAPPSSAPTGAPTPMTDDSDDSSEAPSSISGN